MPKYFISAIQKDNQKVLSHVFIHLANAEGVCGPGALLPVQQVAMMLVPGNEIFTMRWDYTIPNWKIGARVEKITEQNQPVSPFLRTVADAPLTDQLDNLVTIASFR